MKFLESTVGRGIKWLAILTLSLLFAACGKQSENGQATEVAAPLLSAATLGEQQVLAVDEYLRAEPYASASLKSGKQQVQICKACHSFESGGSNMIGPALHGIFLRQAGEHSGFDYSPALRDADFVWTPRALDAFLSHSQTFLPGHRMSFAGVFRKKDRDNLIAFLLKETSGINQE